MKKRLVGITISQPLVAFVILLLSSSTLATHSYTTAGISSHSFSRTPLPNYTQTQTQTQTTQRQTQRQRQTPTTPTQTHPRNEMLRRALSVRHGGIPTSIPETAPPPGFLRRTFPQFPWHRLPDYLTYARCAAIPLLMLSFYYPHHHPSKNPSLFNSIVFAMASFTDWLDGYLARRWKISTAFGAFLDPVADKLMVSTILLLLSGQYGAIIAIPSSIILMRELAVSALREWMAQKGLRDVVQVGYQGKIKTAGTMVALTVLLLVDTTKEVVTTGTGGFLGGGGLIWDLGVVLLYASMVVTVTSGSVYFKAAAPVLFQQEQ